MSTVYTYSVTEYKEIINTFTFFIVQPFEERGHFCLSILGTFPLKSNYTSPVVKSEGAAFQKHSFISKSDELCALTAL